MRILSAAVKNYRVHESAEIDFHEGTTLIGGANEAGKSTIVEAIHRTLFLPAKGQTILHKAMHREDCKEKPEVTLRFQHLGREFELYKRFGGNTNYSVTLREQGRAMLEGDEAEDMLRELTGAGLDKSPRKEEDVRKPWAHLWVWQGAAGDTPTDFIQGDTTNQLVQLTSKGAGTVLMSNLDGKVSDRFASLYRDTYTDGNKVRRNSVLGEAIALKEKCREQVETLEAQVHKLEDAAKRHAEAAKDLAKARQLKEPTKSEIEVLQKQLAAAQRIQIDVERASQVLEGLQFRRR